MVDWLPRVTCPVPVHDARLEAVGIVVLVLVAAQARVLQLDRRRQPGGLRHVGHHPLVVDGHEGDILWGAAQRDAPPALPLAHGVAARREIAPEEVEHLPLGELDHEDLEGRRVEDVEEGPRPG